MKPIFYVEASDASFIAVYDIGQQLPVRLITQDTKGCIARASLSKNKARELANAILAAIEASEKLDREVSQ